MPTLCFVPRCIPDASIKAYGFVCYMVVTDKSGTIYTRLIGSKSSVAPVKSLTLPRLELCGALLLARLLNKVKHSRPIFMDSIYDSVVLDYF